MLTMHTKATPHPEVVHTELKNGEAVLLHLDTQAYYSLNETGSRIWQLISEGQTLEEMGQALEAQYEVSFDRAQQCVIDLISDLVEQELVSVVDAQAA